MQIRYNLSHLEQWTRDMRLHESGVTDTLAPIIQAAQLLQARKTDDDVHSICDMCDKLSVSQVRKDKASVFRDKEWKGKIGKADDIQDYPPAAVIFFRVRTNSLELS